MNHGTRARFQSGCKCRQCTRRAGARPYLCGLCSSPKHRADACPRSDVVFLFARIAWIAKRMPAERHRAYQALDKQWRRDHGYCTECPRKAKRGGWRCGRCDRLRAREYKARKAIRR